MAHRNEMKQGRSGRGKTLGGALGGAMTRALARQVLAGVLAVGVWGLSAGTAFGQGGSDGGVGGFQHGGKAGAAILRDQILVKEEFDDWNLSIKIFSPYRAIGATKGLNSRISTPVGGLPNTGVGGAGVSNNPIVRTVGDFKIDRFDGYFPVLESGSSWEKHIGSMNLKVTLDGKEVIDTRVKDLKPSSGLMAGMGLARWTLTDIAFKSGMTTAIELPARCFELSFDEKKAMEVPWPKTWPAAAESTFGPMFLIDYSGDPAEFKESQAELSGRAKKWFGNQDVKKLPPVRVAKTIAAEAIKAVRTTGVGTYGETAGNLYGFDTPTVKQILENDRQSEEAISIFFVAACRAVGLPARLVIGYDVSAKEARNDAALTGGEARMYTWAEFAMVDPARVSEADGGLFWIPVDLGRQHRNSNRPPSIDRAWPYFGGGKQYRYMVPISHFYHPPTNATVTGFPALWAWNASPLPQGLTHSMNVQFRLQSSTERFENTGSKNPKR